MSETTTTSAAAVKPPTSASPDVRQAPRDRRRPLRFIALLGWLAIAGAIVQLGFAHLLPDDLGPVGNGHLSLLYLAFMAQVFLFHMGVAAAVVAVFALATRRWGMAVLAWLIAILGAGPELTQFVRSSPAEPPPAQGHVRVTVLSANLLFGRADADKLIALAESSNADVLLFQEWTVACGRKFTPRLLEHWPHAKEMASDDAFGEAVFSRHPIVGAPDAIIKDSRRLQMATTFDIRGQSVCLANIHLFPPGNRSLFRQQRVQAKALATFALADESGDRTPIAAFVGDFNATSRTSILKPLLDAGWVDAHAVAGVGRCSTWHGPGMLRHAPGIRIDNTIVAPGWRVVEAKVLDDVGSDHRPTVVTIERVAEPAAKP